MPNKIPSTSVVIAAYNAEPWIGTTLESFCRQTTADFEVIVVDDGSIDRTVAVARSFADRLDLQILSEPHDRGPSRPRNVGIRAARGDLIVECDADDLAAPSRVASLRAAWVRAGQPDCLLFSDFSVINAEGRALTEGELANYPRLINASCVPIDETMCSLSPAAAYDALLGGCYIRPCTAATPRKVLAKIGGYDETVRIVEDYDLYLRLAREYPFIWVREVLASYRRTPGNITTRPIHQLAPSRVALLAKQLKLNLTVAQQRIVRRTLSEEYFDLAYHYGNDRNLGQSLRNYWRAFEERPSLKAVDGALRSIAKSVIRNR